VRLGQPGVGISAAVQQQDDPVADDRPVSSREKHLHCEMSKGARKGPQNLGHQTIDERLVGLWQGLFAQRE
jgi:hypothetical protein